MLDRVGRDQLIECGKITFVNGLGNFIAAAFISSRFILFLLGYTDKMRR